MKTRKLGKTDITVNSIGLGAMPLSLAGHPDKEDAYEVIKSFVEQGGDFIDTANVYCVDKNNIGHNERLVFRCLKKMDVLDTVKIATKGGLRRLSNDWAVDASPMWLRISCEQSLVDLDTRSIFLYQLHAPDPDVPILESIGELTRLRDEGMIQHIGLCNVTRKQIRQVLEHTDIMSVQNRCNVFQKDDLFKGVAKYCEEEGVSYICHSPVGGHYQHKRFMRNRLLNEIADKYETTAYGISLSWLLQRGNNVLPIPGATKINSISNSMKANKIMLDAEDIKQLDQLK